MPDGVLSLRIGREHQKLDQNGLPPTNAFYLSLNQEPISEDDYKHAQKVFKTLKCQSFQDYHMTYLKMRCSLVRRCIRKR